MYISIKICKLEFNYLHETFLYSSLYIKIHLESLLWVDPHLKVLTSLKKFPNSPNIKFLDKINTLIIFMNIIDVF